MKWLRWVLEAIGVLSLLAVTFAGVWGLRASSERTNADGRNDAPFVLKVLKGGDISTNQDFKVTSSYNSARNLTGDHLDYYCIALATFEVADYAKEQWQDGPEKNPLLADALRSGIEAAREHGNCMPPVEQANSAAMKIMFWSVTLHGRYPSAADILLYPSSRRLYYVSYKT
jgi:hypothetical protein